MELSVATSKKNHFDQAAQNWDSPEKAQLASSYAEKIKTSLQKTDFSKVLEIGCGTGLLGGNFLTPQNQYVGIDTSEGMLEALRQKFPDTEKVRTYQLNLDTEKIPEANFDLMISSMAFHHLRAPAVTLARIAPQISPGGFVAIIDLDTEDGSFHPAPQAMGVHHFGFSLEQIRTWAESAGLVFRQHSIIHSIEKNGKQYPLFLALLQNPS